MDLSFYKLRICSADLVLVDDLAGKGRDRDWDKAARAILDRRRGAGADRLAVLARAEADTWLRVFGSRGEGGPYADAAICAARYLLDSGRAGVEPVSLRVSSGEVRVDVLDSASLGISLGPPRRFGAEGPDGGLGPEEAAALATVIESGNARYQVLPLRVGLPGTDGAAIFAEAQGPRGRLRARDGARGSGAGSRTATAIRVVSRSELAATARPCHEQDSCATAALALAAAAAIGAADREAMVRLRGGALWIEWTRRGDLYAVARPEYAYRGEFHLSL